MELALFQSGTKRGAGGERVARWRPAGMSLVGEMVIRPTDTLSGRDGGSASAVLAGYGRPGLNEGPHNQSAEWSSPGVNQAGRRAGLRSTCVCRRNGHSTDTDTLSGREGGSASALLAGYGRPGMSEGAHSQSFECGVRPE